MPAPTINFSFAENIILTAPMDAISGGPELIHQLGHTLRSLGLNAYMTYYDTKGIIPGGTVPEPYRAYQVPLLEDFSLFSLESTLFIIGEMAIPLYFHYPDCQKCIWWLSVDNYPYAYPPKGTSPASYDPDVHLLKNDSGLYHLVQSEYARQFLLKQMQLPAENIAYLSDYLNKDFFGVNILPQFKQNFIAYNPKKGYDVLKPLIAAAPQLTWIPIINMTSGDVSSLLHLAKVYVDFGNHPGKDRIPREAAVSGCCVITNRRGSAAFYEDVPIPDAYKFEEVSEKQEQILALIGDIFNHYEEHYAHFSSYCEKITSEEQQFVRDVKALFTSPCNTENSQNR